MHTRLLTWGLCVFGWLTISLQANAQFSACTHNSQLIEKFLGTKTIVVLQGDESFDVPLITAMRKHWTHTDYKFVNKDELRSYLAKSTYSFIVPLDIDLSSTAGTYMYHFLALVNGGKLNLGRYTYDDLLAYGALDHFGIERKTTQSGYRIHNLIQSLHNVISVVKEQKVKGSPGKIMRALTEHYNTSAPDIKNRTLLVNEAYINEKKLTEADFESVYPFPFKVVSSDRIREVIEEDEKGYYYLVKAVTLEKHILVYDPVDGQVVYAYRDRNLDMDPQPLLKKEIKDMVKVIQEGSTEEE